MMKKQMQSRNAEEEMREAFKVFDRNGDGSIRYIYYHHRSVVVRSTKYTVFILS